MQATLRMYPLLTCLSVFLCVFSACAPTPMLVTIPQDFPMTGTGKEPKIPLRAALYINPSYQSLVEPTYRTIKMGEAFGGGSERMVRNIFRETVVIRNADDKNYDVMVVPEIVRWVREYKFKPESKSVYVFTIKWNVFSPKGKTIYVSAVTSQLEGKIFYSRSADEEYILTECVKSLDDQLLKAQEDIYSNQWWAKQWWKEE
jgi:hypothetical protein